MRTVLTNANVYTCNDAQPRAAVLVVDDGVISYVGEPATLEPSSLEAADGVEVFDLGGRTVLPGFVDSHTHPSMVTQSSWHIRLPWTSDVDEILRYIRDYATAHPPEEAPFLYFEYYPSTAFAGAHPTKELLDTAVSDRPCLCQDFSEHEHWVNSKMLELMEVTAETPDPVPGLEMFVRDERGEPTGLLREHVHQHFMDKVFAKLGWSPPEELTAGRVQRFFRFMSEHGVTALFEALVDGEEILASISELDRRAELNMYYEGAFRFRNLADLPDAIAQVKSAQEKYTTEHVRIGTLKLFLDGTNESGNSAVLAPMCGCEGPDALGAIGMEAEELTECFLLCNSGGVDVHIHLVGDRAFRVACDAVEAAQGRLCDEGEVWAIQVTLAHCELVDPTDMPRPAQLGIIVNWTPHWSGGYFGERSKMFLGDERWNRMYRFNEVADSGAVLSFGSDVVTSYELGRGRPLFGMQVANSRIDPEYPLDPTRFPQSVRPEETARLSLETLVKGYTISGAKQMRLAEKIGSLEVGKLANLVVTGGNLFDTQSDQLGDLGCDAVMFEGKVVVGSLT